MSKKYVILGAGGQLGRALCAMFPDAKALSREELQQPWLMPMVLRQMSRVLRRG